MPVCSDEAALYRCESPMDRSYTGAMALTVQLPDEIAARVQAAAADRGVSADEVVVEAVRAQLPGHETLKAFIGVGASGDRRPFEIHDARRKLAERKFADGV